MEDWAVTKVSYSETLYSVNVLLFTLLEHNVQGQASILTCNSLLGWFELVHYYARCREIPLHNLSFYSPENLTTKFPF